MDSIIIGEVLRIIRISKDLKIKEVSKNTKVSVSDICEIEKGKKKASNEILSKILIFYEVNSDEFYNIVDYYTKLNKVDKLKKYQYTLLRV